MARNQPQWQPLFRPGFFGRRKKEKIAELNQKYGDGNWSLRWVVPALPQGVEFEDACLIFYEQSYLRWFREHPEELDVVCSYGECIDNAPTNVKSGLDYTKQEAFSTHIQDIAIRNVLHLNNRKFEGSSDHILVIRSADTEGFKYGPGNIPFFEPGIIEKPSKAPHWANAGSVEDFWQSNKYVCVKE